MPVTLVRYSEAVRDEWNSFVREKAGGGTFLHLREFYDHNPANASDDHSLLFYEGDKLIAVFPSTEVSGQYGLELHSHLRATYGGLLLPRFTGVDDGEQIVTALLDYTKRNSISKVFVRLPFRFLSEGSTDIVGFLLSRAGFQIDYRDLEFAVATNDMESLDRAKGMSGKTRNQIRKALSSDLVFAKSERWAEFWELLEINLREKYQTKPVHDLNLIQTLRKKVGHENVSLWVAESGQNICAGIVTFQVTPRVVHFQYVASDTVNRDKNPLNGLYWRIVEDARKSHVDIVNFGSATTNKGQDINHGLVHFKEGFGAEGHLREQLVYRGK